MATGTVMPLPRFTLFDSNGDPVSGGLLYTYLAGTTTPATTYSDVNLTVALPNPIVMNAAGRPSVSNAEVGIYLTPGSSYKFVAQTSAGASIWTQDNVSAVPTSSSALDISGTAGEGITAGQACYLSDGSGSKVAGSWYKADNTNAYSSTLPEVGLATSNITSGATGSFRLAGQLTGLAGLTPGLDYYIGASGALTSTAPALRRFLGRADTTSSIVLSADPLLAVPMWANDFRLTLTTAVPITITDVTAAGTLYLTPYIGNRIDLPDSSGNPIRCTSAEVSIAVPAATSQMYDVFAYLNGATVTLELLAWTNDTTRATALVRTNGRLLKTGDLTRMYLGSMRTTAVANQTEDSFAKRYIWNYYNRASRSMRVNESTATWAYTTATYRQARATGSNQLDFVVGVAEVELFARVMSTCSNTNVGVGVGVGIGIDSTSAVASGCQLGRFNTAVANDNVCPMAELRTYPAVGRHTAVWLEVSEATGATTWEGVIAGPPSSQSGIEGTIFG